MNVDSLYRLSTSVNSSLPVSTNSWTIINGASPAIQTYEFVNGNAQIGIEITNASSAVNGTYTWSNSIVVGGGVGTVSGYYKGSGADLIVIYWATNMWKIVNSAGTVLYNGDFQSTSTTPPVSNYSGTEEYWTGVGGLTEAPSSRVSVVGGGGASAPVMKILMKTVQVVIIANDPQVNGIYYLVANPDDRYNSFFSKDGGDSYPRIIYNNSYNSDEPWLIQLNVDNVIYSSGGNYVDDWPVGFDNAIWYNASNGNTANITSSTSTANRPHVYTNGNIRYGRT